MLIVVVVLLISVLAYLLAPAPSSAGPIDVTFIAFQSSDNTCGLNGVEYYGFNASLSTSVTLQFDMNNSNASAAQCTIHTVTATTSGFSIGSASPLPCVVPASETVTWTVTINVPSSDYTGVLTLVVT